MQQTHLPPDAQRFFEEHSLAPDPADANAIGTAWTHSPYLRGLLRGNPDVLADYLRRGPEAALGAALALAGPQADGAGLRRAKAASALVIALADISGCWMLENVTAALSALADAAIDRAIRIAVAERVPDAGPDGFAAIALGKLGSRELNYSSDVDLILLYDRDRLMVRPGDDPDNAAVRIARRVVELLQTRDSNGYVFRVDLRLRPSPEATPIAMPVRGAEAYYQSEALAWERAAFIRARQVGGDTKLGEDFLAAIEPFIWRRSLDYTTIRDIQDISLQIRDHFDERQRVGPGYDLKRGRGGIREVEFYAQIHQLIYGGRDYTLRRPATFDALVALAAAGHIQPGKAAELADAYRMLRTAEHRLQMIEDAQTHQIPARAPDRMALARIAGYRDWPAMERVLTRHTAAVGVLYDVLIADAEVDRLPRGKALAPELKRLGIGPATELVEMIGKWRARGYRALRSDAAQRQFEAALPGLLKAFAAAAVGRQALIRFDDFLEALPSSIQFFALIEANPRIAGLLARVLELAPLLAAKLARRPEMLDILLTDEAFDAPPSAAELGVLLTARTARHEQLEPRLDEVRRWIAERRFQIGVQIVEGHVDPLAAAREYAKLADTAIAVLAPAVEAAFATTYGHVAGGRLIVVGFGRYGGAMLTEQSDLDLVFLFSGSHETLSDGPKPLPATTYFNRLAQRLTAALSVNTAAGPLYEVDTRLRPSGKQGLLAINVESFARYQRDEAWSWEHMALTRARVVLGQSEDGAAVEAAIAAALMQSRDVERLRGEVLDMRADMAKSRSDGGPWDVKHAPGGLIDLEFIIQYLQLSRNEGFDNDLDRAIAYFVDSDVLGKAVAAAYKLMTRLLIVLRLLGGEDPAKLSPAARLMLANRVGIDDFDALKLALAEARKCVGDAWVQVFGNKRKGL